MARLELMSFVPCPNAERAAIVLAEKGAALGLAHAAFAPAFRYVDEIDLATCEDSFDRLSRVARWCAALAPRPSVVRAVVPDFTARLAALLGSRRSHLAALIAAGTACAPAWLSA